MAKLRHIAMVVEEMEKTAQFYEKSFNSERGTETERKFRDPNGQVFDLTSPEYARDFWRIAV